MNPGNQSTKSPGVSPKHTLAIVGALLATGLLVWIIQLARSGDPIGYIILTGLGVLLAMPVTGGVVALLLHAVSKLTVPQQGRARDDLKAIREAHHVLRAQNQYLIDQLKQTQQNRTLLSGHETMPEAAPPALGPGQLQTADGFIIDGVAFDTLDDAQHFNLEEDDDDFTKR